MVSKCAHKGCGKEFTDENEPCVYHPGPPEFHEGQKGWKCCKPRVLTFDEFLSIPPCTTGRHSTTDDTPLPQPKPTNEIPPPPKPIANGSTRQPVAQPKLPQSQPAPAPASAPPDSDSDESSAPLPQDTICRRRGCNTASSSCKPSREDEKCVYHPGQPLFHEGTKGWTCCKRRVLEFDEFMKITGCKTRGRHCFLGKKPKKNGVDGVGEELEKVVTLRSDYYQTKTTVNSSFFLKKIDKLISKVEFPESGNEVFMDLKTTDGKHYEATVLLFGSIDTRKSTFKILGTKLELALIKADGASWPKLRADDPTTGEIIQTGRAL